MHQVGFIYDVLKIISVMIIIIYDVLIILIKWNDVLNGVGFEFGNICLQTGQIKTLGLRNRLLCFVQVKNVEYFVDSVNRSRLPVSAASDGSE